MKSCCPCSDTLQLWLPKWQESKRKVLQTPAQWQLPHSTSVTGQCREEASLKGLPSGSNGRMDTLLADHLVQGRAKSLHLLSCWHPDNQLLQAWKHPPTHLERELKYLLACARAAEFKRQDRQLHLFLSSSLHLLFLTGLLSTPSNSLHLLP